MSQVLPPVCILAGGLGSRLGDLTHKTPKALIEVAGEPFIRHQLRSLARQGVGRTILCVGHLGEMIEDELGNSFEGVEIAYSYDSVALDGTLGALRKARELLDARFLLLYGDTYLRIDFREAARRWEKSGLDAMMTVLKVEDHLGVANAVLEGEMVTRYDKFNTSPAMSWIDYGLGGLHKAVLDDTTSNDLAILYQVLASEHRLLGIEATERFYEIGSPQSLREADQFLQRHLRGEGGRHES